jgi:hypothetical protein
VPPTFRVIVSCDAEAVEHYQLGQRCVLSVSAFHFNLFNISSSLYFPKAVQVNGIANACLPCHSIRKILIWQKDRTQKNESYIFLRSIFLPLEMGYLLTFS